ncbi:MAG: hypothetical protein AB4206_16095 [Xenococcaceae cyanobacterium]
MHRKAAIQASQEGIRY